MPTKISLEKIIADAFLNQQVSPLWSPNESDSNWETANLVDGLFAISRAIHHLADVLDTKKGDQ
jgi:hypothetical protein